MDNTKEKDSSIRFSGEELLKLFAIFLICISHTIQTAEKFLDFSNISSAIVILKLFTHSGQIGNLIFITCSSFYLVDKSKTKAQKVIKMLMDSVIISITIFVFLLILNYRFSAFEIARQFFPDLFLNLSFIPDYIILYLIHPLLNKIFNKLSKNKLMLLLLTYAIVYVVLGTIFNFTIGANLSNYILVYGIVYYIKKYYPNFSQNIKKNVIGCIVFFGAFIMLTVASDMIFFNRNWFNPILSALLIPAVICLFGTFHNLKFKNSVINYLSSCSLFFYCWHENILIRTYIRPNKLQNFYSNINNSYVLGSFVYALIILVTYFSIAILYKLSISKLTNYLSKKLAKYIENKKNEKSEIEKT